MAEPSRYQPMIKTIFDDKAETALDEDAYRRCEALHRGNPFAVVCKKAIFARMFKYGICFYWGHHMMQLSPQFMEIVEKHWIRFAKDVVEELWIRGIVPGFCFFPHMGKKNQFDNN